MAKKGLFFPRKILAYFSNISTSYNQKGRCIMKEKTINTTPDNPPVNSYDDGNIPEVDLPQNKVSDQPIEPLPESTRPRKDGPGGN